MVSFSSTVRSCWWLIYFLLHKLIIPFFIDEIYWFSLSWSCCGWNKRFLSWFFLHGKIFFSDMLNMIEWSKCLVVSDGFFVNGTSPWMLLSFRFLIVCTVVVEIFISEENLFIISIWVVFSSRFLGALSGKVLTISVGFLMKLIRL